MRVVPRRDRPQDSQLVRMTGGFLQQLAAKTPVNHFEITRPSLHDIFVRIARPSEAV